MNSDPDCTAGRIFPEGTGRGEQQLPQHQQEQVILLRTLNSSVINNIYVLGELEKGDISAARKLVESNAAMDLISILECLKFQKDPAILKTQVGLKAAAKHWANSAIPLSHDELKAELQEVLKIVRQEMQRDSEKANK